MPGSVYAHIRAFWGAFDTTVVLSSYTGAASVSAGASAAVGDGVGVRRAVLVFDRDAPGTFTDDTAQMHFDFMNITGGTPDDTWTTSDFTNLETRLSTFLTALSSQLTSLQTCREVRWYRVGHGVPSPNPAERVTAIGIAGSASSDMLPPQVACSLTLKTAYRKYWGRTYLPGLTEAACGANGQINSSTLPNIGIPLDALVAGAAGDEFFAGVMSSHAGSFFAAESIQVDDVFDIIRRRRWRNVTNRYVSP